MLVEFIGAAGVGKSFLSNCVLEELRSQGFAAKDFDDIHINRMAGKNTWGIIRGFGLGLTTLPKPQYILNCVQRITRYSLRRPCCDNPAFIYIANEGLSHRLIMTYRQSFARSMRSLTRNLFKRIGVPDIVVVVEARPERIFARRSARSREGDVFSHDSIRADIEMVQETVDEMERLRTELYPDLAILRVSGEEDGGASATDAIVGAIKDRYMRGEDDHPFFGEEAGTRGVHEP